MSKSHILIGIDCAYRTLGWSVIELNETPERPRDMIKYIDGGVIDVLGCNIDEVDDMTRARRLRAVLRRIYRGAQSAGAHVAVVVIEKQPRKFGRGGGVRDKNQTIEAQACFYFSALVPCVYLIAAGKKNAFASAIMHEEQPKTYAARKAQTQRAIRTTLGAVFNFDAAPARPAPDLADACVQTLAAIFLCGKHIHV